MSKPESNKRSLLVECILTQLQALSYLGFVSLNTCIDQGITTLMDKEVGFERNCGAASVAGE